MGTTASSAACCLSGDDDVREVMKKFKVHNIHDVKASNVPQLVTGRVCPATNNLKSPIKQTQCVYYHLEAKEETKDKGWIPVFTETKCMDFVLADPLYPDDCVAINGKGADTMVRMHSILDGTHLTNEDLWVIPEKEPLGLKAVAARQKYDLGGGNGGLFNFGTAHPTKKLKFFEYSFEVNVQVAILGIITERLGPDGKKMLFINPCTKDSLSEEYYKTYGWNDFTKHAWKKLFEKGPAICVTDDSDNFAGLLVDPFDDADLPSVIGNEI